MLERDVENAVVKYAKSKGCLVRKMNGVGFRGWPDRLFILPSGKHVWIEFKAPGRVGGLSAGQQAIIEQMAFNNVEVYLCDDKEKGKAIIEAELSSGT